MNNPLLAHQALPAFNDIRPDHVGPALDALLPEAEAALERAVSAAVAADYDALSAVLDVPLERLSVAWGAVAHLQAVADTPALRQAYTDNLPRVTEFHTRLGADERLFAKYKALAAHASGLSAPRQRALSNAIRDFVMSGAELQGAARERYAAIQARTAEVAQQYSEHVLDANDGYSLTVTEAQLAGVPADVREAAQAAAQAAGEAGFKLSLHMPCWMPVMQYAQDRSLREQLYRAYITRASDQGPPERDNTALMAELLSLRREEAALLGHASFAELSLVPKMAESPAQVMAFLRDIAAHARRHAERDLAELREFAAQHLGLADLQPWDLYFASEKLKEARYAFSEQAVKQYFTEPRVLDGLFRLIETSLGQSLPPKLIGQFYLDPYARPGKRPGAWMDGVRSRWLRPDSIQHAAGLQTPVAHLVCNFAAPVGQVDGKARPALLTHDDVITLFHEFGHGLHHLLTQVDDMAVAGIAGVVWVAVEFPSQLMVNFCCEW